MQDLRLHLPSHVRSGSHGHRSGWNEGRMGSDQDLEDGLLRPLLLQRGDRPVHQPVARDQVQAWLREIAAGATVGGQGGAQGCP